MKRFALLLACALPLTTGCWGKHDENKSHDKSVTPTAAAPVAPKAEFASLFDGKSLDGWKVNENPESFKVEDGCIVVNGKVSHLFYDGPVANHEFKNFHFKAEVKTFEHSNSGIYFHTKFQEHGFPQVGFEAQVNATHGDRKKTGGLYNVKDVMDDAPNKDGEWFTYEIIAKDKNVQILIDGKESCNWTQPEDWKGAVNQVERKIGSGTFALQGHDPGSKVLYKNIMVKVLE